MSGHPNSQQQFQPIAGVVRHKGDYQGQPGEISINVTTLQLLLHDGCVCNGVAYAQLELTDCAKENAAASTKG